MMTMDASPVASPAGPNVKAGSARTLLTLSRLYETQLNAGDNPEVAARLAVLREQLASLDARHAKWFDAIPEPLLIKVNGSADRTKFLRVGEGMTRLLKDELSILPDARTILDFGVGLSRVLWPMIQEFPESEFIGFDVDPMMLHHTEQLGTISEARIVHSTQPIASGTIDATYVISVFTHLMETADFWLGEIHRLLSDRGQALITFHDETLYAELRETGRIPLDNPAECEGRVLVGVGAEGSTQLAVFYDTAAWNERLERFFVIEKTEPRGRHQSFSVVRRGNTVVDYDRLRHEYMRTLEEELYGLRRANKLLF